MTTFTAAWQGLVGPESGDTEAIVARNAGAVALGGGIVFLVFAPLDALARAPTQTSVLVSDLAAGASLVALSFAWRRDLFPRRHANAFLAAVGAITLGALTITLVLAERVGVDFPATELNLGLVVLAMGALMLSWRWLAFVGTLAAASGALVLLDSPPGPTRVVFASMFVAAGLVHGARMGSVRALLQANRALDDAQRAARIGSLERDLASGAGRWSPMLIELFEQAPEVGSLTVEKAIEFVTPDERPRLLAAYRALAAEGTPMDEAFPVLLPSGARRSYRVRGYRVEDARGRPTRIVATVQDETARVAAERAADAARAQLALRERLAAVGTLAAGVAHEVNNPLMYAGGALETAAIELDEAAKDGTLAPATTAAIARAREDIATAKKGVDRIAFITTALQRATVTRGGPAIEVDPNTIVHRAVEDSRSILPPDITIRECLEAQAHVRSYAEDTGGILLELLKNACEAMRDDKRGGIIEVTTRDEGGDVIMEVSDDGPGVAPGLRARLFTPFFTTKSTGVHAGLSLSIAHQAARDQGGVLEFAPREGGGATFRLRLPRWDAAAPGS